MKFNSLLVAAAVAATVGQASAFEWEPSSLYPVKTSDVTNAYSLTNLSFQVYEVEGVTSTDVMPAWVDEDGNEISAVSGSQDSWNPNQFFYTFDIASFKSNGDYILLFPEGMLMNAAGEKSDKVQIPYTVELPELAPAMFDDFKILSITPDLSEPQALWNDQVVTINTNHNDAIGLTTLQITDKTLGESVTFSSSFSTGRELGDDSPISWEVVGSFKFFEGHEYVADFTFYNGKDEVDSEGVPTKVVDRVAYTFTGRVEGFKYSDLTLLSVAPAPMSTVISQPSQAVFTYTFSGPVSVYKAATPLGQNGQEDYPASCLSSNEDKTVWTLDLSDNEYVNTVDAMLTIYIYARDLDGFQLKGDWGEEYESCFMNEWQCDLGAFPIVVASPVAGESIDRLSEIVVKAADGEPMSWSWMGEAYVMNQLGEILWTLVYDAPADEEADSAMEEIRFSRWMDEDRNVTDIDLVKEGYYAVQFGPGCFLQGDQFTSKQSKSLISTIVVTGALDEPVGPGIDPAEQEVFNYTQVDPANGATVEALDIIKVYFPEEVSLDGCDIVVYNAEDEIVTTGYGDYDWDTFAFDYVLIKLNESVTAAGQYEVVIPARTICNEAFGNSGGTEGICNPEIRLTYTVGGGSSVGSVEAADSEAVYYDLAGRRVLNPSKGIYIVNGKKVVK